MAWLFVLSGCTEPAGELGEDPVVPYAGTDYDLTRRCAATTPGDINFYSEGDCPGGPAWTLVVQSENAPGASSPGPATRSFPINGPNSPVTIGWYPHTSELGANWTVNMKVDHATFPHPGGEGYFTWFAMMDHVDFGGGPLPEPLALRSSHSLSYAQWTPSSNDAARLSFGAQAFWGGRSHLIEVLAGSGNWGDAHPHPGVRLASSDWFGDGRLEYLLLDGAYWGLTVTPGAGSSPLVIDWGDLFARLIAEGWLSPITGTSQTEAVYVSVEVKNRGVADLWHTDFRVSQARWSHVVRTFDPSTGDHDVDDLDHPFAGYREATTFDVSDSPATGLAALYNCDCARCTWSGVDRFLSLDSNCEGYPLVHRVGYVDTAPAASRVPVYRCTASWGDHFVTRDPDCEGQPKEARIVLGYTAR